MSANYNAMVGRIESKLRDVDNSRWGKVDLEEAINEALSEYSKIRPLQAIGTVTVEAASWEVDVSTLSGLLEVVELWLPYTAADPETPPNRRAFQYWRDAAVCYLMDGAEPAVNDVARAFYTRVHTVEGMDGAAASSYASDDETLLVTGAAGYAATSRSVKLIEEVTLDRQVPQQLRAWGMAKLQEFRAGLNRLSRAEGARGVAMRKVPAIDRWDGDWS